MQQDLVNQLLFGLPDPALQDIILGFNVCPDSVWIRVFSSTERTRAFPGGFRYSPRIAAVFPRALGPDVVHTSLRPDEDGGRLSSVSGWRSPALPGVLSVTVVFVRKVPKKSHNGRNKMAPHLEHGVILPLISR